MTRRTTGAGHRVGRILLGLAALLAIAALLIAVPIILIIAWRYLGPPIPTWTELTSPDDGTLFVRTLCLIGWAGWATFTWAVLAELVAKLLGWRLPALRWQQRVAAGLITAIVVMVSSPAVAGGTPTPVHAAPVTTALVIDPPTPATEHATAGLQPAISADYLEHRVQPGEQMPALAERYLGDKYRWQAIAAASYGLTQPDGRSLQPGDTRIYPGWTVRIPTDPATAATQPASHPLTGPAAQPPVYQVARGDWLWHIADRFLGDPNRYTDIAALNPHLEHRDGRFPDHIEATWHLTLPADAHDRGPRAHATGTAISPTPAPGIGTPGPDTTVPSGPGTTVPNGPPGTVPREPAQPSATPVTPHSASPTPGATSTSTASPSTTTTEPGRSPTVRANGGTPTAPAIAPTVPTTEAPADDDSILDHPILIGVPLLGAGLLATLLLARLRRHRSVQQRHRPVGRRLPEPAEPEVETHMRVVAEPSAVDRLDHALRVLAAGLAGRPDDQMPDMVGAWLHHDTISLLLTQPCPNPPAPWTGDEHHWTLPGDVDLPDADGQLAPLPTLVAVGSQPGIHLLLDLERLGLLTITGDPAKTADLLRYLAAELACNAWSDHTEITIAGFDSAETAELLALAGDRIDAAPTIANAVERIHLRATQVVRSLDHLGARDTLTGRIADMYADAWMPHVLLVNQPNPDDITALQALDHDLAAAGRSAVAVAATTGQPIGRWPITIDPAGTLTIDFLGMTGTDANVIAAGLPRPELGRLADLLTTARAGTPQPHPPGQQHPDDVIDWPRVPPAPEPEPWAQGTDAVGGLLDPIGTNDPAAPDDQPQTDQSEPTESQSAGHAVWPTVSSPKQPEPAAPAEPSTAPPATEVDAASRDAARVPAVVALAGRNAPAKRITAPIHRRHHDPSLDDDLRAWNQADNSRPRIAILGPVLVHASGPMPNERLRFYGELVVYLAARGARGATSEQFDEAIWPGQAVKPTTRRVAIARARRWLGQTPDGEPWLADATADRRYRLRDGYLLDWHLFRRLRGRGESRGPAGTTDLRQALELVRGVPLADADLAFSHVARNPYVWLPTSEIQPHHLVSAIVDTAHRLVELSLDGGDPTGARWAIDQAWLADPDRTSDITWRDLLRVAAAEGNAAELDQLLDDLMRARDAEVPEDLDKETYRLLCDLMPERMRAGVR